MTEDFYGLPPSDEPEQSTPISTIVMIGGLVVAAIAFVVVGIGFAVGWWGPGAEEPVAQAEAPADDTAAETGEAEPQVVLPGAELMPTAEDRPAPTGFEAVGSLAGAEPVPEIPARSSGRGSGDASSGGEAGSGSAGGSASPGSSGPRVSVTFVLGHYETVEIKLGGKVISLDAKRTLKLRPGGYRVELRKSPDADWRPAGLIDIQVGSRYQVTLFDPPLAKLEVIE